MSDDLVAFWLILVMCISLPSVFIGCFMAVRYPLLAYLSNSICSGLFKIGVYLGLLGLCVQTYRSLFFFQFGHYPIDVFFPTWATKDLGFCFIILALWIQHNQRPEFEGATDA